MRCVTSRCGMRHKRRNVPHGACERTLRPVNTTGLCCVMTCVWSAVDSRRSRCSASTSVRKTSVRTAIVKCCTPGPSGAARRSASSHPRSSPGTRKDCRPTRSNRWAATGNQRRRRTLPRSSLPNNHLSRRYERRDDKGGERRCDRATRQFGCTGQTGRNFDVYSC